ncbi:HMG box protein [Purpureocillium lilacinum]|nr:HMG box protein [Purpureocillium lilacinum]
MASAPSTLAAAAKLTPQAAAARPSFHGAALPVRCLSATAWARSPAASSNSSSGAKKAAGTKTTKKKKTATKTAKKAAPKKPKKKAKKVLTPEEKEKAEIKELKNMALLKGPSLLPETLWSVYVADNLPSGQGKLTDKIKEVASRFSGLSEYEKDRLRSTAQSNQTANKQTRQQWIESYPPEAVYMANVARRRLARRLDKSRVYLIHDDRLPKRAGTPYTLFVKSRFRGASASGGSGASAQDTFRAMSAEWKSMSEADKKPFQDMARDEAETSRAQLKELKDKARAYWKEHKGGSSGQVPS